MSHRTFPLQPGHAPEPSVPARLVSPGAAVPGRRQFARLGLAGLVAAGLAAPAGASLRLLVQGVGATRVPVGVKPFEGDGRSDADSVAAVMLQDFARSGLIEPQALNADTPLDNAAARTLLGVVSGQAALAANGDLTLRWRLFDPLRQQVLAEGGARAQPRDHRLAIHRMADEVQRVLTGVRGVAATRIAYIAQDGPRYELKIADADGHSHRTALTSREALISPAWSPDGRELAYVSFERGQAQVWVQELASGRRRLLAAWRGSNSAPSWSPDGRRLALALSRDGLTQVYVMDAAGGEPLRVTRSSSIDTEPTWAPDGQSLFFVSDRGGAPQVYRTALDGSGVQRVSWGTQGTSPAACPDGRHLAYVAREGRAFRLVLQDLHEGTTQRLTDSEEDERPSFAPNGRLLAYATRQNRRDQLKTTSLDGRTQLVLASSATHEVREPAWGPWIPDTA
jgi:TolB protein